MKNVMVAMRFDDGTSKQYLVSYRNSEDSVMCDNMPDPNKFYNHVLYKNSYKSGMDV